ncbi:hypothetical protein ACV4QK_19330 [Alteromonas macleodii]
MSSAAQRIIFIVLAMSLFGCGKNTETLTGKYSIISTSEGKLIRLNSESGETCVVSENCDTDLSKLKAGESYTYMGDGIFKKLDIVDWEDLN